jgi:toxin ParE1/3/4
LYEDKAPGLGRELLTEVERVLGILRKNPAMGSPLTSPYRRLLCQRFPFAVIYREDGAELWVQAVMHLRRRPGYWKDRG